MPFEGSSLLAGGNVQALAFFSSPHAMQKVPSGGGGCTPKANRRCHRDESEFVTPYVRLPLLSVTHATGILFPTALAQETCGVQCVMNARNPGRPALRRWETKRPLHARVAMEAASGRKAYKFTLISASPPVRLRRTTSL